MNPSNYDLLHDRFYTILSKKLGTRYERLAAVVFRSLDQLGVVVHDMKLVGESGVSHQIDVTIQSNDNSRRVLIECKDFDQSENKVGLDTIEKFWAVVSDLKPDETIVVSCIGFTQPAQQFAKAKHIKLAILREFRESDWENRVRRITIVLEVVSPVNVRTSLVYESVEGQRLLESHLQSEVGLTAVEVGLLGVENEGLSFGTFVDQKVRSHFRLDMPSGHQSFSISLPSASLRVRDHAPVVIKAIQVEYDVVRASQQANIEANSLAINVSGPGGRPSYLGRC